MEQGKSHLSSLLTFKKKFDLSSVVLHDSFRVFLNFLTKPTSIEAVKQGKTFQVDSHCVSRKSDHDVLTKEVYIFNS